MKAFSIQVLIGILCFALGEAFAETPQVQGSSPQEIIEQLWISAAAGDLLSSKDRQRALRYYQHPEAMVSGKPILVVSNYWGLFHSEIKSDQAAIDIEYEPLGTIDSKLRFKPAPDDGPCMVKYGILYHLSLLPTYSVIYRTERNRQVESDRKRTEYYAWQITDPPGAAWTTVNTAIRYVLEKSDKATDPVTRTNANHTLRVLLHYH